MPEDQVAETTTTPAASAIGSVAADLRDAAAQKLGETVSAAKDQANDAKASVASEVKDVAQALRRAAEDLRGGSAQERTIGKIADGIADASDALRDKDLGEIWQSANKVARENPILFIGGAVLLGFAVSRFAKSSADIPLHLRTKKDQQRHQVDAFVDEGNPNTEPVESLP